MPKQPAIANNSSYTMNSFNNSNNFSMKKPQEINKSRSRSQETRRKAQKIKKNEENLPWINHGEITDKYDVLFESRQESVWDLMNKDNSLLSSCENFRKQGQMSSILIFPINNKY